MKRYFIYFTTTLTLTVFAHAQKGQSQTPAQQTPAQVQIQDDGSQDDLKAGGKAKFKKKGSEEIIIKKKDASDKKTVIVIEDGKVTIDGKPSGEWNDGSVFIKQMHDFDDEQPLTFNFDQRLDQSKMRFKILADAYGERKVRLGVYTRENEKGAEITQVIDSSAAAKAGLERGISLLK